MLRQPILQIEKKMVRWRLDYNSAILDDFERFLCGKQLWNSDFIKQSLITIIFWNSLGTF